MRIYLHTDGNEQAGLRQQGKGLIICNVFAIISDSVVHGCPRDEEEDEWAVAAVQQGPRKGHLTEILVQLSRSVQLGVLETPAVIYVLHMHTYSWMNLLSWHCSMLIQGNPYWYMMTYLIKETESNNR